MLHITTIRTCEYIEASGTRKTRVDFELVFVSGTERNRLKADTLFLDADATDEQVSNALADYLSPLNEALSL